ncbi:MAG: GIY-YIG nuclease family protein [Candidatus Roizmanbacteria bacterium]
MKFYYVYVLQSMSKDFIYIGYSEDLRVRLRTHNAHKVTSTKHYAPLTLIHYEAYRNMKDAKRREEYLKSNKGRTTLVTMLREFCSERS